MREAAEIQRKQEQHAIEERKNSHIQVQLTCSFQAAELPTQLLMVQGGCKGPVQTD